MANKESISFSREQNQQSYENLEAVDIEQREQLRQNINKMAEQEQKKAESDQLATRDAIEKATNLKDAAKKHEKVSGEKHRSFFSQRQREASFTRQMNNIHSEMKPSEQRFSKIIHNRAIEKTSDLASNTIARPNALLWGSIFAFVLVTLLYLITQHYGYVLSGFETIGAFLLGWVVGLIFDYLHLLVKGRTTS